MYSYDPINDQENAEIQLEFQDESSVDEVFKYPQNLLQIPKLLSENHGPPAITMYNQPIEISDDQLRRSVTSLKIKCNTKLTTGCFLELEIERNTSKA